MDTFSYHKLSYRQQCKNVSKKCHECKKTSEETILIIGLEDCPFPKTSDPRKDWSGQ